MDISIESKTLHHRWRGFLTSPSHAYSIQLILKSTINAPAIEGMSRYNITIVLSYQEDCASRISLEAETMFMQKFKASPRFLGVLFLRVLLGIVVGYLWLFAVAFIFHTAVGNPNPTYIRQGGMNIFEIFDYFYDSGPPREGRYGGTAGTVYGAVLQVGLIGFWVWFAVGVLWGFSQGRLDLRKWLRKRHA